MGGLWGEKEALQVLDVWKPTKRLAPPTDELVYKAAAACTPLPIYKEDNGINSLLPLK